MNPAAAERPQLRLVPRPLDPPGAANIRLLIDDLPVRITLSPNGFPDPPDAEEIDVVASDGTPGRVWSARHQPVAPGRLRCV